MKVSSEQASVGKPDPQRLKEETQGHLARPSRESTRPPFSVNKPFNFNGMKPLYLEAEANNTPTIAFKVCNGIGQFLFMMFFSEEDEESRDKLYIFLARTRNLLKLKAYGSHRRGDFKVYINHEDEVAILEELDIHGGVHKFDLERFLGELNAAFPKHLSLSKTIETLRDHQDLFKTTFLSSTVDDALKIYLIGPRALPPRQRPREKTLRKLYLYVKADPYIIADFVTELKKRNKTVAWTDDPRKANNNTVRFLNTLNL
jgi:hypothetical protein